MSSMSDEMRTETSNYSCEPTEFFPYTALPSSYVQQNEMSEAALKRIFENLCKLGLYVDGQWQRNRFPHGSDGERTAEMFNRIRRSNPGGGYLWLYNGKPAVVLVSSIEQSKREYDLSKHESELPNAPIGSIFSFCELMKMEGPGDQKNASQQQIKAKKQLIDMAGHIMSTQGRSRRFLVGLILCNSKLTVALFIRGCTIFTTHLDINTDPLPFINIILTLSSPSPTWTGLDYSFYDDRVRIDEMTFAKVVRTISRSLNTTGRGTAVYLCKSTFGKYLPSVHILKDCWINVDWPTDVDVRKIMTEGSILPIEDPEEDEFFGERDVHGVFQNCVSVHCDADWDYTSHKLPGIPIMSLVEEPEYDLPDGKQMQENGSHKKSMLPDTTENILRRLRAPPYGACETHKHVVTVSDTVGVPITFFSCRRELINGLMGAVAGHFNGIRLNVLHCNITQNNLMLRVANLEDEDAFPDSPCSSYVKRAGVLANWGLGQRYPPTPSVKQRKRFVTGAFSCKFIATELLSPEGLAGETLHMPYHDLESFFWVLWIICINFDGPCGRRREWVASNDVPVSDSLVVPNSAPSTRCAASSACASTPLSGLAPTVNSPLTSSGSTHSLDAGPISPGMFVHTTNLPHEDVAPGSIRYPVDGGIARYDIGVPVWATPEPHKSSFGDVYIWRKAVNEGTILQPISPYFQSGPGGKEFREGMLELLGYFRWRFDIETNTYRPPAQVITHKAFFSILAKMRDAIDDTDQPSLEDLQRGRQEFRQKNTASQASDIETLLKPPSDKVVQRASNSNKRAGEDLVEGFEGVAGPFEESGSKRSRKRAESTE